MREALIRFRLEIERELGEILSYWEEYGQDAAHGDFYGQVDDDNIPDTSADKGSVLFARILWTFSHAYQQIGKTNCLKMAEKVYQYILDHFVDREHGGMYWTVDNYGKPRHTKKQIYAQAFCIYGLSEFYKATGNDQALAQAIDLFYLIERHSFDQEQGGYYEAFTQDWEIVSDVRLSEKDQNDVKTMNTHLHVVEAYASLYAVWPDNRLKERVQQLLDNFFHHFLDKKTGHLLLFFDAQWQVNASTMSFGHDMEAAWLLQECAERIFDEDRVALAAQCAKLLASAALEGQDTDGGLFYESDKHLNKEKLWWVQAEAMVGFFHMYQITADKAYLQHSLDTWKFIQTKVKSSTGEWWWGLDREGSRLSDYYKIGLWKCPYHNGRACMEIIRRVDQLLQLSVDE